MLEVRRLSAYYGRIQALKSVSIEVAEGEAVSIIGANGAGKSTLLKSISGLTADLAGAISFQGEAIARLSPDRIVARGISHVPEGHQVIATLSVSDNLAIGAYLQFKRKNRPAVRKRLDEVCEVFPVLRSRSAQLAGTLSGGERQMVAIARALMANPKLLLLDEPSMGLAPLVMAEIFGVIRRLNAGGVTLLLVEQNAQAALRISGRGYVLETGQIVLADSAGQLLSNPQVKEAYLGG